MRAALAAVALTLLASAPASAAPETTLGFGLPRGTAVAVPHVEGRTVVDGSLRIPVDAETLRYVGTAGSSYVVEADDRRILRVEASGATVWLSSTFGFRPRLDGDRLVTTRIRRDRTSTVTVRSITTRERLAQRTFRGTVSALDVAGDQVLVGGARRTALWDTAADDVSVVSPHPGYEADLGQDLVAVVSKPGIEEACTDVLRVSTGDSVWSSCDASLLEFGPGGQMATTSAYQDGPLGYVELRSAGGTRLATYRPSRRAMLGEVRWETPEALLIGLESPQRTATARCTGGDCELAGRPLGS